MEQKRTLWILAAVGVFLLVVLGAALIFYSSSAKEGQTIAVQDAEKPSNGWISLEAPVQHGGFAQGSESPETEGASESHFPDMAGHVSENTNLDDTEKTQVAKVGDMTVIADSATVYNLNAASGGAAASADKETDGLTTIDLRTLTPEQAAAIAKSETEQGTGNNAASEGGTLTIVSEGVPVAVRKPVETAKQTAKAPQKTTAKPAQNPSAAAKSTPKQSQKTAAEIAKKQYWVQVTSLTSRKSADEARAVLDENKISADVFTYEDGKNQLFYRVRVGPYMTKVEAEYWQAQIAKIERFSSAASYVTSTN